MWLINHACILMISSIAKTGSDVINYESDIGMVGRLVNYLEDLWLIGMHDQ